MSDDQPTVPPPESGHPDAFAVVVAGLVERVTRVEVQVGAQENRIVGLEESVTTMSGQLEGVVTKSDRHEGDLRLMRAAIDQVVAGFTDLQHGQADIKEILKDWTPVLKETRVLLSVKAKEEEKHSIELGLIREQQTAIKRWLTWGVGGVTTVGAVFGAMAAVLNFSPLMHAIAGNPWLFTLVFVGVVLVLCVGLLRFAPLVLRKA